MLKWREDYYVGEGIKDAAKARRRIDAGRVAFGVYLVTLSENPGKTSENPVFSPCNIHTP